MDKHNFYIGKSFDSYDYFWAHTKNWTTFRVYTPNADKVCLIGEFNNPYVFSMELRPNFAFIISDLTYKFTDKKWMKTQTRCYNRPLNIMAWKNLTVQDFMKTLLVM